MVTTVPLLGFRLRPTILHDPYQRDAAKPDENLASAGPKRLTAGGSS